MRCLNFAQRGIDRKQRKKEHTKKEVQKRKQSRARSQGKKAEIRKSNASYNPQATISRGGLRIFSSLFLILIPYLLNQFRKIHFKRIRQFIAPEQGRCGLTPLQAGNILKVIFQLARKLRLRPSRLFALLLHIQPELLVELRIAF